MNEALFTDEPLPKQDLFTDEPSPEKSVGGFVKNIGSDIVGTAKGLGNLAVQTLQHPIDTPIQVLSNLPKSIVEEGKRIGAGELLTGHPINAMNKFGNAMYEKPLTTTLDVLPAIGAAGKLLKGMRGAEGATMAGEAATSLGDDALRAGNSIYDDIARVAPEAQPPLQMPGEAINILKESPGSFPYIQNITTKPPPPLQTLDKASNIFKEPIPTVNMAGEAATQSVPTGSTFQETVQNLKNKIPSEIKKPLDQVQEYLTGKYGQMASKPGIAQSLGDYFTRKAQGMRLKEMGASPMQIRKLVDRYGEDKLLALSDIAKEKGITNPMMGYKVGKRIEELSDTSGKTIGGLRKIATQRGAVHNMDNFVQRIRSQLEPVYKSGMRSGEKNSFNKALAELKKTNPTPDAIAKKITEMNRYASENKMVQTGGAYTDVANAASKLNNELISKVLSPKELEAYHTALTDFGAAEAFKKFYGYKVGRELAGRTGPSGIWNKFMDVAGNKFIERGSERLGQILKTNPEMIKNPRALLKEVIDQISGTIDEVGENLQ